MSKVVQFPYNKYHSQDWQQRLIAALGYTALLLLAAWRPFSGDLLPFMLMGLLYYSLIHYRRLKIAHAPFVRYHLLQALSVGIMLKVGLVVLKAILELLVATLALIRINLPIQLVFYWLANASALLLLGLLLYCLLQCLRGRQHRLPFVSSWVNRMV